MPHIFVPGTRREGLLTAADERWSAVLAVRPELRSAVELQRRLLELVIDLTQTIEGRRLPRLSLPPRYLAAKLARGVPALAGEPIPLPVAVLTRTLLQFCGELAASGAGEAAEHIQAAIDERRLDAGSLLLASLSRDQEAIRTGATHRGLAPDLVWLVAELAVGPFAYSLQRTLFAVANRPPGSDSSPGDEALAEALHGWQHGYCPACGSWPALAEVVEGHRTLRCSFCATAWELPTYACVYCAEDGEPFVTAAPDEDRKDRRVEVCSGCGGYMKTVDLGVLSPFPLLAIGDLETMDLDMAAMEHGYAKPAMREFNRSK
ncbi:MAG: formate dehydrogenase accessory protein FdhE [Acidobacteriota bacterium]